MMNKIIKPIASVMIAILIFALVFTFLSYYDSNVFNDTIEFPSGEKSVSALNIISGDYVSDTQNTLPQNNEGLIESIRNESPEVDTKNELPISNISGDNEKISGDSKPNNSGDVSIPNTIIEIPSEM